MGANKMPGHPSHQASRSDPTHLQSGLKKELDKLGRTRGSSVTPASTRLTSDIISPKPQRGDIEKRIITMNRITSNETSPGSGRSGDSAPYGIPGYGGTGLSPTSASDMSALQRHPNYSGSQQIHNGGASTSANQMTEFSNHIQTRLIMLKQSIIQMPEISSHVQAQLTGSINSIGQEFNTRQRPLQAAFDNIKKDHDELYARALAADKDRAQAFAQLTELKLQKQQSSERLNRGIQDLRQVNEELIKKVDLQEEQLKGKRSLWMQQNSGPSNLPSIINSQIRDPFNSPSSVKGKGKKGFPGMMGGPMGSIGSPSQSLTGSITGNMADTFTAGMTGALGKLNLTSASTSLGHFPLINQTTFESPPVNSTPIGPRLRRRGQLPTGNPAPPSLASSVTRQSILNSLASLPTNTEPGSLGLFPSSHALVLHGSSIGIEDPSPRYEVLFAGLFEVVEDWCKQYASLPNPPVDEMISTTKPTLWNYMMNCTYPGHLIDANAHVLALLHDTRNRYLFIVRMAITYCVKDIMTMDEFETFSPVTEETLLQCKKSLAVRGLANEVRQTIINRQHRTLGEITKHPSFPEFRASRLLHHTKQLRDMLGPVLNIHISRSDAGKDLGILTATAYDVCLSIFTSCLTFQVFFPETSSKFHAATMASRDMPNADPLQLQVMQARLKLVITPVVTLRDDRDTSIRVKNLHKAHVLTMN